jgi:hypothetical protein
MYVHLQAESILQPSLEVQTTTTQFASNSEEKQYI